MGNLILKIVAHILQLINARRNRAAHKAALLKNKPAIQHEDPSTPARARELLVDHSHRIRRIMQLVDTYTNEQDALIQHLINRAAENFQLFPASQRHHHHFPGGLTSHSLEVLDLVLGKLKSRTITPLLPPLSLADFKFCWTLAAVVRALAHDAGKLVSDIEVFATRSKTCKERIYHKSEDWSPLVEDFLTWANRVKLKYFAFNYVPDRNLHTHTKYGATIVSRWLTDQQFVNPIPQEFYLLMAEADSNTQHLLNLLVKESDSASTENNISQSPDLFRNPGDELIAKLEDLIEQGTIGGESDPLVITQRNCFFLRYPEAILIAIQRIRKTNPIVAQRFPSKIEDILEFLIAREIITPKSEKKQNTSSILVRKKTGRIHPYKSHYYQDLEF